MILKNLEYLNDDFKWDKADIEIEDGRILKIEKSISYSDEDMVVDCEEFKAVPGFIDVHTHGNSLCDASDGTAEGIQEMASFLLSKGVTSFCPTTVSLSKEDTEKALLSIKEAKEKQTEGAAILGVHLEGPFFAKSKKGAHTEELIIDPEYDLFEHFHKVSGENIKIVSIAPERPGADEFIEKAKEFCTVSFAHSAADYDTAVAAFEKGITHATHMFNAMQGLNHRDPGAIGAIFNCKDVKAEIICDGKHIHYGVVKAMFDFIGDRLIVISDAMRLSGMPDGSMGELGGLNVVVEDGTAKLEDGTIAGSVTNLFDEFKNLISWGVPLEVAIKALTINPATAIKMQDEIGSIKVGKRADILILDEELNLAAVYH